MRTPSVKAIDAGPSHGSIRHGMELVERLLFRAASSRSPLHGSGIIIMTACGKRPARQDQQLQGVVEHGRIAAASGR